MQAAMRMGRCINSGRCGLAGPGPIPIKPGEAFRCPECLGDLVDAAPRAKKVEPGEKVRGVPKMLILPAVLLSLLIGIGLYFDLFGIIKQEDVPAMEITGGEGYAPAGNVRNGTSIATYDLLAPMLWRGFLTDRGCASVASTKAGNRTVLSCEGDDRTSISISAPDSVVGVAGTAMKTFDVVLTTDASFAGAPGSDVPGDTAPVDADTPSVHANVIGIDALAVIINPANPLARLSQVQLAGIFIGQTIDFAKVGGRTGPIHVVAPSQAPQADDRLNAIVPQWLPLAVATRRFPTSAAIVEAVMADPAAIGLVEAGAVGAARVVAIGPSNGHATAPTPIALISGDYPLARPVYAVRFNRADSSVETEFIAFARSSRGQTAIVAAGFEPLRIVPMKAAAPAAYTALVATGTRMAADLRFVPGTITLDARGIADLDAAAARLAGERIGASRIIIIGLAGAAPGDAALADSAALARRIATALGERGVPSGAAHGLGAALPLAEAGSVDAERRNRRVEIWIAPA